MSGGSQQLRRFRIARRYGDAVFDAARLAGISLVEARMHAADDDRNPPPADAFTPLATAFCATCARDLCGCPDADWMGRA